MTINYPAVVADLDKRIAQVEQVLDDLRIARRTFMKLAPQMEAEVPRPVPRRPHRVKSKIDPKTRAMLKKRPYFSHLVRSWRQHHHYVQASSCRLLGIGSYRMSLIETGQRPRARELPRMAQVLQLPVTFLESVAANQNKYDEPTWTTEFVGWAHQKDQIAQEKIGTPKQSDEAIVEYLAGATEQPV